jgi:hypothetical protein
MKDKKLRTAGQIADESPKNRRAGKIEKQVMQGLLDAEPALAAKLIEAIKTGHYLVTVTFQKKYAPDDKNDLHHFWTRRGLSPNDLTGSLRHLLRDYNSKENPNAMTDEAAGGGLY